MKVEYVDHMGDDLRVVNAARVSFDKQKAELDEADKRLITYLARHNHFTPFAQPSITLRFTVPIFVDRQLVTHKVGAVRNEVSRRYVDTDPEFWIDNKLGMRAENKKQGAKDNAFITTLDEGNLEWYGCSYPVESFLKSIYQNALSDYKFLLDQGVAPEDARIILPLSTYTSYYLTGSLYYYWNMYNLRSKPEAQRQIRQVADMVEKVVEPLFPVSWLALKEFS